jgi:hypothetical protein
MLSLLALGLVAFLGTCQELFVHLPGQPVNAMAMIHWT